MTDVSANNLTPVDVAAFREMNSHPQITREDVWRMLDEIERLRAELVQANAINNNSRGDVVKRLLAVEGAAEQMAAALRQCRLTPWGSVIDAALAAYEKAVRR